MNIPPFLFGIDSPYGASVLYQPSLFKHIEDLIFGQVFELAFAVDMHQVDFLIIGNQEG